MPIQYKNKSQTLHTKTSNDFSDNLNLRQKLVTAASIIEANVDNDDDDFSQFENPVLDRLIDRSNLKVTPNIYRGQKNPDGSRNEDINLDKLRLALRSLSAAPDFLEFENIENSILYKVLHITDISITTHHYKVISQACEQIPDLIASLTDNIKTYYKQGYRAGDILSNEKFLKKIIESNDYQFYDEFDRAFKSNLAVRIIEADKRFFEKAFEIKRLPESLLQEVNEAIDSLMTINSAQQWLENNLFNPVEKNGETTFLFHGMINAVIANLQQVADNQEAEQKEQAKANEGLKTVNVGDLYTYRRGTVVILDRSQRMLQIQGINSKRYIIINDKYFYNSGNAIAVADKFGSDHTNERISNITRGIIYTDNIRPVVTIESRTLVPNTNTAGTRALVMSQATPATPIMLYNNLEISLNQINTIEENLQFLVRKDSSQITQNTIIILNNIAKNIPINDLTQLINRLDINFKSLAEKLINQQAGKQIQSKFPKQLINITSPKNIVENIIEALARKFGEPSHAVGYKPNAKDQQKETQRIKSIENEIREKIGDEIKSLIANHDHEQLFKALNQYNTDLIKPIMPAIVNIAKKFASDIPATLRDATIIRIFRDNLNPAQENTDHIFTDNTKNINVTNTVISDIINNISNNFKRLSIDEINKIIGVDLSNTLESLHDIKKQIDIIKDDITTALKSLASIKTLITSIRQNDSAERVKSIVKNINKSINDTINNFTAILDLIPQLDQRLNANNNVITKIEKTIKSINITMDQGLEKLTSSVNRIGEIYDVDKTKSTLLKDLTRVKQMFNDEVDMLKELITNMAKSKNQSAVSVLEYIKIVNTDIERISVAIQNERYSLKILKDVEHLKNSINYINININSLYKSPEARNAKNQDDSKVSTSNYDNVIKCINAQTGLENARILVQLEQPFNGTRLQIVASKNHKKMNKKG